MKFYYFVVILAGIIILLNAAGISTPSGDLVKTFNIISTNNETGQASVNLSNIKNSQLWKSDSTDVTTPSLYYLMVGLVAVGIAVSFFGRSPDVNWVIGSITFTISGFIVADIVFIWSLLSSYDVDWITWGSAALLGALLMGFIVTMLEFWRGGD